MQTEVVDSPQQHRYEILADGKVAGFAAYALRGDQLTLSHTEIDDAYEGNGLGSVLVRQVLEEAGRRGLAVLPSCPFVRKYLQRHDEYVRLVPAEARERYGLSG